MRLAKFLNTNGVFKTIKKNHKALVPKTRMEAGNRNLPFTFEMLQANRPDIVFMINFFGKDYKGENATEETKKRYKATQKIIEALFKCLPIMSSIEQAIP